MAGDRIYGVRCIGSPILCNDNCCHGSFWIWPKSWLPTSAMVGGCILYASLRSLRTPALRDFYKIASHPMLYLLTVAFCAAQTMPFLFPLVLYVNVASRGDAWVATVGSGRETDTK